MPAIMLYKIFSYSRTNLGKKMGKCEFEHCAKHCYFGFSNDKLAKFCAEHKLDGMVNVIDRLCETIGCEKRAGFNYLGETKKRFCNEHRLKNMVNVTCKRCRFDGCSKFPHYNMPNQKGGKYCLVHKLDGMVNIVSRNCLHENCIIIPQYNFTGMKKGIYCSIHKLEGMIDVKHKRCEQDGCSILPSYCYITDTQPRYCSTHKLDGMIDAKHPKCIHLDCNKQSSFGTSNGKPLYCLEHKPLDSFDVSHKLCEFSNCIIRPIYNYFGIKGGRYCAEHKLNGMVDINYTKCISEWCQDLGQYSKSDGYCMHCYIHLFPDKPVVRNYKTKERAVVEYVHNEFPNVSWISDRKIYDGCSRRRPDLFLDLGYNIIIVEIDENQHDQYDCSCENKRLMEISQDVSHRNIVFIRFNTDEYLDKNGSLIKSCWKLNKQGMFCISSSNQNLWMKRLGVLKEQIQYWMDNSSDKMVEIVQLFYDANM